MVYSAPRLWQQIGAIIGNHSATHRDFNSTPIDVYLKDIARAQALIDDADYSFAIARKIVEHLSEGS